MGQALNWTITILFFATPISTWMGNASQFQNLVCHYQGLANEWAALQAKRAAAVDEEKARDSILEFKAHIKVLILDQFFKENGEGRDKAESILDEMRLQDVLNYIRLARNQAISSIDI